VPRDIGLLPEGESDCSKPIMYGLTLLTTDEPSECKPVLSIATDERSARGHLRKIFFTGSLGGGSFLL